MTTSLHLAIDQGGQSSRALVFDVRGRILVQSQCAVAMTQPQPGWAEQDAEQLAQSVNAVVDSVTRQLGHACMQIVNVGLATQRSNVLCWRRDTGTALSAAISWQDRRAYRWLQQFDSYNAEIHQLTGLLLSPHYGASKLRWCWDHLSAVREAYAEQQLRWGPLASYLAYRLTGCRQHQIDPANASRTLLLSLKELDWSPRLLELFGVPGSPLPRCTPTLSDYGEVPIADRSVPLRVVTGDQSAALFAFGEPQLDVAYVNVGTGAFVQRSTGNTVRHHPGLLSSIVYHASDATHFVLEGTVNGAGSALRSVEKNLGLDVETSEQQLEQWLSMVTSPPLFLNGVAGLGAPFWVPDFESRFVGDGDVADKMVAVVESIVFLIQVNLVAIRQASGDLTGILVTGGLAQSNALCQRLADLSGLRVRRPAQCEATAQGVAYLLSSREPGWASHVEFREFVPRSAPALADRYRAWHAAMQQEISFYG